MNARLQKDTTWTQLATPVPLLTAALKRIDGQDKILKLNAVLRRAPVCAACAWFIPGAEILTRMAQHVKALRG
jgi:hypothetical protein